MLEENTQEATLEELIKRLPRSVIDFNNDGSFSVHPVDMVQAQMDREKEFGQTFQQLMNAKREIANLKAEIAKLKVPVAEEK